MPDDHAAFRAGESVRLADAETLQKLQGKFGWHDLTPKEMASHAGVQTRIRATSCYHGGTILYEFDELPGYWLEPAIVDLCFDPEFRESHPIYRPADETYIAAADVVSGPGFVSICDHTGRMFRRSYHHRAAETAANINEVARIRARASFENHYGFDGIYPPSEESPVTASPS